MLTRKSMSMLALSLFALGGAPVAAQADVLYAEDFDSLQTGEAPSGWTINAPGNNAVTVEAGGADGSAQALKAFDSAGGAKAHPNALVSFSSPFTADTDDAENRSLYIGFFWKVEDAAGNLDVRLRDTDTVAGPRIVFGNNSGMIRAPGGGGQDLEAVVVNQWNYAYLTITESALHPTTGTHTFDVTIVQGDSINTYTDLGFHSTDVTGIGEFWFQMQEAGPHTGWIDEIRVQTTPFFDEVIPEPASVFLLAAGGLCAATRRRGTA